MAADDSSTAGAAFFVDADDSVSAIDTTAASLVAVSTINDSASAVDSTNAAAITWNTSDDAVSAVDSVSAQGPDDADVDEDLSIGDGATAVVVPGQSSGGGTPNIGGGGGIAGVAAPWQYHSRDSVLVAEPDVADPTIIRQRTRHLQRQMVQLQRQVEVLETERTIDFGHRLAIETKIKRLRIVMGAMAKAVETQHAQIDMLVAEAAQARQREHVAQQRLAHSGTALAGAQQQIAALQVRRRRAALRLSLALGIGLVAKKMPKRWRKASYATAVVVGVAGLLDLTAG